MSISNELETSNSLKSNSNNNSNINKSWKTNFANINECHKPQQSKTSPNLLVETNYDSNASHSSSTTSSPVSTNSDLSSCSINVQMANTMVNDNENAATSSRLKLKIPDTSSNIIIINNSHQDDIKSNNKKQMNSETENEMIKDQEVGKNNAQPKLVQIFQSHQQKKNNNNYDETSEYLTENQISTSIQNFAPKKNFLSTKHPGASSNNPSEYKKNELFNKNTKILHRPNHHVSKHVSYVSSLSTNQRKKENLINFNKKKKLTSKSSYSSSSKSKQLNLNNNPIGSKKRKFIAISSSSSLGNSSAQPSSHQMYSIYNSEAISNKTNTDDEDENAKDLYDEKNEMSPNVEIMNEYDEENNSNENYDDNDDDSYGFINQDYELSSQSDEFDLGENSSPSEIRARRFESAVNQKRYNQHYGSYHDNRFF